MTPRRSIPSDYFGINLIGWISPLLSDNKPRIELVTFLEKLPEGGESR